MKNKKEAVVAFSGGQDSTTCLAWAATKYDKLYAGSFAYGQRHQQELACAAELAAEFGAEHIILDLKELNRLAPNSLTRDDIDVDKEAPETGTPNSFVEGRNLLFLTYAAIFAKTHGVTDIITGVSQSDFSGYPDCRDVFIKSLNVTLNLAMDYEFDIITPLMWIDKEQTWEMADNLGVFDLIRNRTLTCYNGIIGDGCGDCPSCKLRRRGLERYLERRETK